MTENCLPSERPPEIRVLAMPADTNASGDIFGGWLMSQVDIAGSIAAIRVAQGRIVTVAVDDFHFIRPVFVGDLVSIFADIERIGTTSVSVKVRAYAERQRASEDCQQVAEANLTYVAVTEDRKPRPIKSAI